MDREKVIKGLECCCEHIEGMNCDHCPYDKEQIEIGEINQCTSALAYDALALLKEQEAVVPYQHDAVWLCGNCENEEIGWDDPITCDEIRYPFCRKCGKKVKWE